MNANRRNGINRNGRNERNERNEEKCLLPGLWSEHLRLSGTEVDPVFICVYLRSLRIPSNDTCGALLSIPA